MPATAVPRGLLVVARNRPDLFEQLSWWFREIEGVQVIFDRRHADRRQRVERRERERRRGERRRRVGIEAELRAHGFVLIRQ